MTTKIIPHLAEKLAKARIAVWISYALLLITLLFHGINDNVSITGHILTFLLKLLPLLIFIPGMKQERYKTFSMLGFVCLMYFTFIVVNLFEVSAIPNSDTFDIIEVIFVSTLFISTILFSRWKQYSLYQQA